MTTNIGYIGLGNIGKPMCACLIQNVVDARVHVYDVVDEPVLEMVAAGGVAAQSPRQIAGECEQIGICVRDDGDVDTLLYEQGMLDAAKPGTILAIHSTVTRDNAVRWAADAEARGVFVLDAGITGGAHGAAAGELAIMIGGDEAAAKRAERMFVATAKKIVYCGGPGSGIVTKLALNLVNFQSFVAITEGVDLMKAAGLDPERLLEVGKANGVVHPLMELFIAGREGLAAGCTPEEAAKIFAPPCGLAEKDLDHALALAGSLSLEISSTAQARKNIRRAFLQEEKAS